MLHFDSVKLISPLCEHNRSEIDTKFFQRIPTEEASIRNYLVFQILSKVRFPFLKLNFTNLSSYIQLPTEYISSYFINHLLHLKKKLHAMSVAIFISRHRINKHCIRNTQNRFSNAIFKKINRCLKLLHTPKVLIEQEEDNPQNVKKNNR